jgi:hypothetical protein
MRPKNLMKRLVPAGGDMLMIGLVGLETRGSTLVGRCEGWRFVG